MVLYHAGLAGTSGGYVGVDVFFVISGYLITGLMWRELDRTGRVSLSAFYGRRARRLLPASVLVLVVTLVAALEWLPPLQLRSVWKDGLACALYVGNYRFAAVSTDYLTASAPPSPFQHYWSLGVEEQFYLVWPILLVGAVLVGRRLGPRLGRPLPPRAAAAAALGTVAAASLAISVILTRVEQPWAFFSLPSRAWELALGGLAALFTPRLRRLPVHVLDALGWLGVAAIIWSVVQFNSTTAFPGAAALVPVLGSAAVLVAGVRLSMRGAGRLLRLRGMQFVGRISYSLYLWHWPLLIVVPYAVGHPLPTTARMGLVALAVLLSAVTFLLVERPARNLNWFALLPRRSLAGGATLSLCAVGACLMASEALPSTVGHGVAPRATIRPVTATSHGRDPAPGPTSLPANPVQVALASAQAQVEGALAQAVRPRAVPANLQPPLASAKSNQPARDVDGCLLSYLDTTSPQCLFGQTAGASSVVLFGDSHATMWFPAVDAYANHNGDRLYVWTKATCPPVDISFFSPVLGRQFSECATWRTQITARIAALHPKLVVLGIAPGYNPAYHIVQNGPQWLAGLTSTISAIRASGAHVVVIGPIPSPPGEIPDCLSAHLGDAQSCDIPLGGNPPGIGGYSDAGSRAEGAAATAAGATYIDVRPDFCSGQLCPVTVDNLLVYRDNSHITADYASYLAPVIEDELTLATG